MSGSGIALMQSGRRRSIAGHLRAAFRLTGPAFAVSVGYIDPGNWATDLAAGTYGYQLLWSVLLAGVAALVLQFAVAQVTLRTREDLATLISRRWRSARMLLWIVFQVGAAATDVAEFAGIVLGLKLLFNLPLLTSVMYGGSVVICILAFSGRRAMKLIEYALLACVGIIAAAILTQAFQLHPQWHYIAAGAVSMRIPDYGALLMIVGVVGATVMPHNLFLHSSLIARDLKAQTTGEGRSIARFVNVETVIALTLATIVNAALLVIGAGLRGGNGSIDQIFAQLHMHAPPFAQLFGGAFLLSGIAASITATTAGDYIFAALAPFAVRSEVRRAVTLLPAIVLIVCGVELGHLLIWSQVLLGIILPFVLLPLVRLSIIDKVFPAHFFGRMMLTLTCTAAGLCAVLDGVTVLQFAHI